MFSYKNNPIQREELFTVLNKAPNVTGVEWTEYDKNGFSRTIKFLVHGTPYKIEWWTNTSNLKADNNLLIPFEYVEVSGTWPNRYKTNLQFYTQGEVVAILPLEEYEVK